MKIAIILIPESGSDATADEQLARIATDAGWSLRMVDDAETAIAQIERLDSFEREPPTNGVAPDTNPGEYQSTTSLAIENTRLYDEVRQARELLHVTLSSIGDAVASADENGRVVFMNAVAEALSGWRLADAIGRPLDDVLRIVDGADESIPLSPAQRALEHGAIVGLSDEALLVSRNGDRIPIEESAAPIRDSDGVLRGIVAVFRDVSERKRSERERLKFSDELVRQRQRLNSLVMSVPGVVWEAWGEPSAALQQIDFVSDNVEGMLGYAASEWLATPNFWLSIVHPGDRVRAAAEADAIFASGANGTSRFRWIRRDGNAIWVEAHSVVVCDSDRRPIGMRGVTLDITDRVIAEHELLAQSERLAVLNEFGRALSAELDMHALVATVTDAATRLCDAAYGSFFANTTIENDPPLIALSGLSRDAFAYRAMPRASELFPDGGDRQSVVRIDDTTRDVRYGRSSPYFGLPTSVATVVSYLSVAIVSRSGEILGGLFFGHPSAGAFTELDARIVSGLAAHAAIAMDNARLYREAQDEIAERRHAEEEMMRARDEAESANRAKDQFLAVLSHELRTPLTPVLAVTHVLENDDRVTPDQRPLIEMIRRNVELEARLIDDLLDLTRISKGKISLSLETVDIHRLVNSVVSICRSDLASKGLEVFVDLQARDHFIRADSARIQQVLWNLVKNATKFTADGGRVTVRTINPRPGRLCVEVVDTGIGIDASILPRIFNAFDQGAIEITRQFGGLGLGLSISRSLVEMHGGVLTASSEGRNRGSTFTVELDTVVRIRIDSSSPVSDGARRSVRVLIVDDHIETSKVMKLLLERRGYVVHAAHTLNDALEATRTNDFDLLISDIGLPDGTGLDLMRSLADRKICGIALSGFGMEEDIARSKEAGFAEHLIKPVSFQALQETIGRVLL